MERHPVGGLIARWVLSVLLIAGVMAMHVLGGHDAMGSGSMGPGSMGPGSMGPGSMGIASTGVAPPAAETVTGAPFLMDMAAVDTAAENVTTTDVTADAVQRMSDAAPAMPDMSCCILFLITSAALVLIALMRTARRGASGRDERPVLPGLVSRRRGPPGSAPPPLFLCVLRV